MLQLNHMDIAKVDRGNVAHVTSVSKTCCKHLFKMFHLFLDEVANVSNLDILYVSHKCCNNMF